MPQPYSLRQFAMLSVLVVLLAVPAAAERPAAPQLLPESTVAYVRIRDSQEFIRLFQDSNFGRLINDEKIQAVLSGLYGSELSLDGNLTSPPAWWPISRSRWALHSMRFSH